ncbi:MAG: glycoside hydrolase family 3 N-terminal domain-containing protein [Clostridiaceae bacterium]|nr:glycoside hydrolase family 3 N-terminal domain-containing protein [Clostridiaceae bacterium]
MKKCCVMIALALVCAFALAGCAGSTLSGAPSLPAEETSAGTADVDAGTPVEENLGFTVIPASVEEPEEEPPQEPEETDPAADKIEQLLGDMTLEERVAQMFFVGCPSSGAAEVLSQYALGGYILFASNLSGLTADDVRTMLDGFQERAEIPLLIGVDEEGGTVVRVSSNPNLRDARFLSPRDLYAEGGMERVVEDAHEKSQLLLSLGINVNLAPVCDVTAGESDFMYARSFSGDAEAVSDYVSRVVEVMCEENIGSVLKHFPGYGNCADTHVGMVVDHRAADDFYVSDFLPFTAGVQSGARAVMVCHNISEAFDAEMPASLSPAVHEILRETLGGDVVVLTDDLDMDGITDYTDGASAAVQAVMAGNDMLLTSDYAAQIHAVLNAVQNGAIPEERINESVRRILAWKISLGLIAV